MKSLVRISYPILICTMLPACSSRTDEGGHSFRVFQENGISVAETTGGPKYTDPLFTLEEVLILQQDPDIEESMLFGPVMLIPGEDGRYYVSDARANQIVVYDETGVYLFRFGQQGYGPGDFAGLGWLNIVNGEIHAFDQRTERISRFSPDGHLLAVITNPFRTDLLNLLFRMHLTEDGDVVAIAHQEDYRSDYEWVRQSGHYYSSQGDSLLSVQSDWVREAKIISIGNDQFDSINIPFGASPQVCYSPVHGFVSGTGQFPELKCTTLEGQRSKIRFEEEPRLITAEDRSRTRAWYDQRIAEAEGAWIAILQAEKNALEWPEHRPFWQQFELDDHGYIWMEVFETVREREEAGGDMLYRVLSPEGEYLGNTRIPWHGGAKGFSDGYLSFIRTDTETGEYLPTVYRLRPAVRGLRYP